MEFLQRIYDAAAGTEKGVPFGPIAEAMGFTDQEHVPIIQYLKGEGFLDWSSMGHIQLTHQGIVAVEEMQKEKEADASRIFTQENRVKLYYLLLDLLPPPLINGYHEEGGRGLRKLDAILRRELGCLELAGSREIGAVMRNFILAAPENELLRLIEYIPRAHYMAEEEFYSGMFLFDFQSAIENAERQAQEMKGYLNRFLHSIGSPAQFLPDGSFSRDGAVSHTPVALSCLPNKDVLLVDLNAYLKQERPFALIYIDLDEFKPVNDTLGHAAGDRCLKNIVEMIGEIILKKGKLYRYGGDEFVVALPNSVTAEALATAERIRAEIDNRNPGGTIKVTTSIGVISSRDSGITTGAELLNAADKAMYFSKKNGRNRVSSWSPSMDHEV